jgi:hypothetical protein
MVTLTILKERILFNTVTIIVAMLIVRKEKIAWLSSTEKNVFLLRRTPIYITLSIQYERRRKKDIKQSTSIYITRIVITTNGE